MLLFGIPYLVNYAYKLTKWILAAIEKPARAVPQPSPAEYTPPEEEIRQEVQNVPTSGTIGFRCKNCGNDSAVFENGELVCTKCRFKN